MPRVVGVDPGTLSFDLCGLQDGRLFLARSVPTSAIALHPEIVVEALRACGPLDCIVGPSGYGLPLVRIQAARDRDIDLACLPYQDDGAGIGGMRTLLRLLRGSGLPVVLTPGVVHLSTVPRHRKINRIDLGTADKVCAAAAAMAEQARRFHVAYQETSFVLVELGGAFTATLSVVGGRIVSGQGGSSGSLGYLACGALDAEVACLVGRVTKRTVFSGGVAHVAGSPDADPETLAARSDEAARRAVDAFVEGVVRGVAAELAVVGEVREILLSGRLSRVPPIRDRVVPRLAPFASCRPVETSSGVKEAAWGAAAIADGLAGGAFRDLVDVMKLSEAAGTAFDDVYVEGFHSRTRQWETIGDPC